MGNIYEASGRAVKLLRKDFETIKNKTDEINEQLKTISQRISGIEAQLAKIEGHISTITSSEK